MPVNQLREQAFAQKRVGEILPESSKQLIADNILRYELLGESKEAGELKELLAKAELGDDGAASKLAEGSKNMKQRRNGRAPFSYSFGFILITVLSNSMNFGYALASGRSKEVFNILSYASMPISWTCGWMHMFSTIEYEDMWAIYFHSHCLVTLMGIAFVMQSFAVSLYLGAIGSVVAIFFWGCLYKSFLYCFRLREYIITKYSAVLSSKASDYMFHGITIIAAQAYLACDSIGACVFSETYPSTRCAEYARGNCIVGWQLVLGWSVSLMLFDTGGLSRYKVLTMRFSRGQWIAGIFFVLCVILAMYCYATRISGVPMSVQVSWCVCAILTATFSALSVSLVTEETNKLNDGISPALELVEASTFGDWTNM